MPDLISFFILFFNCRYNGVAFVSDDLEKLQVLKSILDSNLFWSYLVKNAKPYSTGYYSLSGVDIKNFGIPTTR